MNKTRGSSSSSSSSSSSEAVLIRNAAVMQPAGKNKGRFKVSFDALRDKAKKLFCIALPKEKTPPGRLQAISGTHNRLPNNSVDRALLVPDETKKNIESEAVKKGPPLPPRSKEPALLDEELSQKTSIDKLFTTSSNAGDIDDGSKLFSLIRTESQIGSQDNNALSFEDIVNDEEATIVGESLASSIIDDDSESEEGYKTDDTWRFPKLSELKPPLPPRPIRDLAQKARIAKLFTTLSNTEDTGSESYADSAILIPTRQPVQYNTDGQSEAILPKSKPTLPPRPIRDLAQKARIAKLFTTLSNTEDTGSESDSDSEILIPTGDAVKYNTDEQSEAILPNGHEILDELEHASSLNGHDFLDELKRASSVDNSSTFDLFADGLVPLKELFADGSGTNTDLAD